jgi:FixJ family two-component response regulator
MSFAQAPIREPGLPPMPPASDTIFVVDDDVSVRESLELLIENEGWNAETFPCAQEFLDRSRIMAPSCLILDVSLPSLNGLELQQRIGPERNDMPISLSRVTPTFR